MALNHQSLFQVSYKGPGNTQTSQLAAMAAFSPPSTVSVNVSEAMAFAARTGRGIPQTNQVAVLVAFRTGGPENLRMRAFTVTIDGHEMYVLHLGEQGTFIYDFTSGQWSQWRTTGLNNWNIEYAVNWNGDLVGGDAINPTLWRIDPETHLDDGFKSITRVATGGLSVRQRSSIGNYQFYLTASLGRPSPVPATVTLSYSDDQGVTFTDAAPGAMTVVAGDFDRQLVWWSLGQIVAPGRIYRITDVGGLVRLSGADTEIDEEQQ